MTIGERIRNERIKKGYSQEEVSKCFNGTRQMVYKYESGLITNIPTDKLEAIANFLLVSPAYLMGWDEKPLIRKRSIAQVPLVGNIACGSPICAEQNIEDYFPCPPGVDADFCLKCRGDSMLGDFIPDGSYVFIKQQEEIKNGEIAAVLIGDEATLKHIYFDKDSITIAGSNVAFPPKTFTGKKRSEIKILGKAVHVSFDLF